VQRHAPVELLGSNLENSSILKYLGSGLEDSKTVETLTKAPMGVMYSMSPNQVKATALVITMRGGEVGDSRAVSKLAI
jgi:hypothetical protein